MSIFARVIAWFAEEFIVKTLAKSKRFQQLALRIDHALHTNKTVVKDKLEIGKKVVEENINKGPVANAKKFFADFQEEIKQEIRILEEKEKQQKLK